MSGQVSGPYTVDVTLPGTVTNMQKWADAADAAATAARVDVGSFSSKVYVLPPDSQFNNAHTIRNRVWIADKICDSKHILSHELGHTFGATHSSIPGSENAAVYGDASSTMGGLLLTAPVNDPTTTYSWDRQGHWNAPEKINAGWLSAGSVQTVSVGGSYRVAMLEQAPSTDPQVLKIGVTYISYRRGVGYDSDLWNVCGYHNGGWAACTPGQYVDNTSIHTWSGSSGDRTYLLQSLADGQSWTDGHVTVTQTAHDATHAYLTVTFSAP
jgi:hypothetical protein